jgi:hypothetical protein
LSRRNATFDPSGETVGPGKFPIPSFELGSEIAISRDIHTGVALTNHQTAKAATTIAGQVRQRKRGMLRLIRRNNGSGCP